MNDEQAQWIASQLRMPSGEHAGEIAQRMNENNAVLNRRTIELLFLLAGDVVVEVGMGNGHFVQTLFERYPGLSRYLGCDFSADMITAATQNNKALVDEGKVAFHLTSADRLPLDNSTADMIYTVNTLYFWDDELAVLQEFRRVLKHDGRLVIAIRPRHAMKEYPFTRFGFKMFESHDVEHLLSANGFNVVHTSEQEEPPQQIDGKPVTVKSLIITSRKS